MTCPTDLASVGTLIGNLKDGLNNESSTDRGIAGLQANWPSCSSTNRIVGLMSLSSPVRSL